MRICLLSPVGFVGGAERCLLTLVKALRDDNMARDDDAPRDDDALRDGKAQRDDNTPRDGQTAPDIHVICCGDGPLVGQMRQLGATVHVLPMPAHMAGFGESGLKSAGRVARLTGTLHGALRAMPATIAYARSLRRLVRLISPDVVHSNGMKTHLLSRLAGDLGCPVVWHVHDFVGTRPLMARGLRLASGRCAGAVAISPAVARDAAGVLPGVEITTVMNATDTELFSPGEADGAALDALAGLPVAPPGTLRVGLVATYARWKGQDVFLDAAAGAAKHCPAVRFYVIGGPVYATSGSQFTVSELRSRASTVALEGRVGFVPFQHNPVDVYRSLDVVVHASTQPEPFGLTIIEAMSCGKPVVVSAAGGAAELFEEGADGLGFAPGNADELSKVIRRLLDDQTLRHTVGARARKSAVERYSRARYGREMLSVYQSVLSRQKD